MEKIDEQILLTESFDVHQDWETPIPGFYIVASRDLSKKSVADFTDAESVELALLLKRVRKAMSEALGIEVVYFFENEDTEHSFHFWMFPRHAWMNQFGPKVQSIRPIIEFARQTMATQETLAEVKEAAEKMRLVLKEG